MDRHSTGIDWTSDEAVVRAAVPTCYKHKKEEGFWIWIDIDSYESNFRMYPIGLLGKTWTEARQHPRVVAFERENRPAGKVKHSPWKNAAARESEVEDASKLPAPLTEDAPSLIPPGPTPPPTSYSCCGAPFGAWDGVWHGQHNPGCQKASVSAAPVGEREVEFEDFYFVSTGTDGIWSSLVRESALKQGVHDVMCTCNHQWDKCESEGVPATVRQLDDVEEWEGHDDFPRFSWFQGFEDGYIRVTRLTDVAALSSKPSPEGIPERPKPIDSISMHRYKGVDVEAYIATVESPLSAKDAQLKEANLAIAEWESREAAVCSEEETFEQVIDALKLSSARIRDEALKIIGASTSNELTEPEDCEDCEGVGEILTMDRKQLPCPTCIHRERQVEIENQRNTFLSLIPTPPTNGVKAMCWERIHIPNRGDIIGVRTLPSGQRELLMHNEALCAPYYVALEGSSLIPTSPESKEVNDNAGL